ncbi:MAG: hypothetical protein Q9181_003638 [Wetmoreana brouardii]
MASPPFLVKAVYEYSSPHEDDLKFPVGQVINVTDEEGEDWYYGEYTDQNGSKQEGLFPRNFVKQYEPETPPRPSRLSRSKKELESSAATNGAASTAEAVPATALPLNAEPKKAESSQRDTVVAIDEPAKFTSPSPTVPQVVAATKPPPSASSNAALPPATDSTAKPTSGSFRDRINAFNKPAAPPVAPKKPSGLGSSSAAAFVKKPFVAPPPSKNAYVPIPREAPPQNVYRREEELEAEAQGQPSEEIDPTAPPQMQAAAARDDDNDDQPKPTSLKERIALLQKQQMEQAARQADAAQKKEKTKRPSQKRIESQERVADGEDIVEDDHIKRVNSGETASKQPLDAPLIPAEPRSFTTATDPESPEATPLVSPSEPQRDPLADPNDADMSGAADTEEGENTSTSRGEAESALQGVSRADSHKVSGVPPRESDANREQDDVDEDEDEDEVDTEVKRRLEIRERMAKMSGGMGMAGMFGPAGGMAPLPPKRQMPSPSEKKPSGHERRTTRESTSFRAPPVPVMPGLTKVQSPEQDITTKAEVSKEGEEDVPTSVTQGREPADMPDVEDLQPEPVAPSRRSTDQARSKQAPHGKYHVAIRGGAVAHESVERPVPPPPSQARGAPPLPPSERPVPQPPPGPKSVQPPPPSQILSPSEGSESDDELSEHARKLSLRVPTSDDSRPVSREGPPPVSLAGPSNGPPTLPSRPRGPPVQVPSGSPSADTASNEASPTSPTSPSASAKRSSRPPPIPGSSPAVPPPTPQNRAPPPPPPTSAPPSRVATGDMRAPPPIPKAPAPQDSDEEVTEYEGDYDTDIASGAPHKAALKSHSKEPAKESNLGISFGNDELHRSGLPSSGPSRAVPPLPPTQPPKGHRQSSEIPRAAPPPPPIPPPKEPPSSSYDQEYDSYNRSVPNQRAALAIDRGFIEDPTPPQPDDEDDMYSAIPPQAQRSFPQSPAMSSSQYASPPSSSAHNRPSARQSLDFQRTSTSGRRSMDAPRASTDQGFIAADIDLRHGSHWWTQPDMPPPALQNRRDVIYETEDSTTTKRGGRQAITRNVYVLYMDYSQTIIAAHFEARDPSDASLEQHHEPPPPRLRQDQLENAHTMFGARIAESASSKKETTVGDGSPNALVLEMMTSLRSALRPVGTRAYGALVYANLANASVQQFDEIRSGDIVTFRNARFQGHRGAMHAKYSMDIGKPDHVGIVVDWDGTKKKVRAWEQGRESRKVKMESFKLGDMKSGEVKVWRVMARQWVGWE